MTLPYTAIVPGELFAATGDDLTLFRSLSHMFLDTAPALFARMETSCDGSSQAAFANFISSCHTLRGIVVLVGAHGLAALLLDLEYRQKSHAQPMVTLAPARQLLDVVCREVAHSIDDFFGTGP